MSNLPYPDRETGQSSGWSGSDTSKERAHEQDANGTTAMRHRQVLAALTVAQDYGMTWPELAESYDWHHGQASGALSNLHKTGRIARLAQERRDRCAVYVLPEYVNDRPTAAQGRPPRDDWPLTLEQTQDIVEHLLTDGTRQGLIYGDTLNKAMGASARRRSA